MSRPIIEVEGLSKRYRLGQFNAASLREEAEQFLRRLRGGGRAPRAADSADFWALRDVSFTVQPGEVVGIIGRNGAGKSTLLKILSRVTEPTSGQVRIRGRVASLLEVGTGFHPELTGRENIFLNGAILGMTHAEIRAKFDEIVDFAEVEQFLDTPVKRYSSGMYVRLAFAVAAHLEPEVLIVDEVLAVGDAEFQKKCLGKMQEVSGKGGRTVLFVSHNMPSVASLCTRCILLEDGAVVSDGDPSEVIQYYSTSRTIQNSDVQLRPRPDTATIPMSITDAWIDDSDGYRTNAIMLGGKAKFGFTFKVENPIRDPGFGFGIEDSMGRRVCSFNNYFVGEHYDPMDSGVAILEVDDFPLIPGRYSLTVSLFSANRECLDYVEDALVFTVMPGDFYGSGRIPESIQGVFALRGSLNLNGGVPCKRRG